MRIAIDPSCRLYVDAAGPELVPDGAKLRKLPTLILLHGGPGFDHAGFRAYFPRFQDIAQVLYYDHRGMGRSDRGTSEQWNLAQWGLDLAGLIDQLGIERPIILGQSFGGFVALEYAT